MGQQLRWYQGLTKYHWWVLIIGVLSWSFDCMDQQIFVRSRQAVFVNLLQDEIAAEQKKNEATYRKDAEAFVDKEIADGKLKESDRAAAVAKQVEELIRDKSLAKVNEWGYIATAMMIFGWSVGGFFFGIYGDKLGRVKTLGITISVYSIFTGLSGLATGPWDFCFYRFVMGCGIGGAFATAATLIAETLPDHSRATALGLFQALSAVGNVLGVAVARFAVVPEQVYYGSVPGWRILFFLGTVPAILAVLIMRTVEEPQAWRDAKKEARGNVDKQLGDLKSLFTNRRWRRNTFVGVSLAVIGVIGLWGIGFWSPELITEALRQLSPELQAKYKSEGLIIQNIGAFFGMVSFTYIATRIGRRLAFGLSFLAAWVVVSGVFLFLSEPWQVYPMYFLLGFVTLAIFGGYAIYFPELYPARLRSTGTGFCYNVGRVIAASVMLFKIPIDNALAGTKDSFRHVMAAFAMVYLLGFLVLLFAPETKGKPLPTDEDEESLA